MLEVARPGRGKVDKHLGQFDNAWLPACLVVINNTNNTVPIEEQVVRMIVAVDDQVGELIV